MTDAIDLFAGAGGLALGLKEAGVNTVCAVEIDRDAVGTFAAHTPTAEVLHADIRRVDLGLYRGKVELVCGGPPCQPFSSGGLRASASDARNMLPWFVNAIGTICPRAFLMENVPGLTVGSRRAYFDSILAELQSYGYFISWQILNAADYGVPQNRRRLFAVGLRERPFRFPDVTHGVGRPQPYVAVSDVLPPHQHGEPNPSPVAYAKKPHLRPSPFHGLLFNGGGRPLDTSAPAPTVLASAGGNKTHFFDDLDLVPEYHRHLLRGGAPRTGTLPGARRLTVLESVALQTFPVCIRFCGSRSAQYEQIGNAVPPQLAAVVGKALVEQMHQANPNDAGCAARRVHAQQRVF